MFAKKDRPTGAPVAQAQATTPVAAPPPPVGSSGWFAGFGDAPARGGGSWICPGSYLLRIKSLTRLLSENEGTRGHQIFIGEFTVVEVYASFAADPGPQGSDGWGKSNQVGEDVSTIQNVTKHGKTAMSNVKGLFLAIARNDDPNLLESDVPAAEWQREITESTEPPGTKWAGQYVKCTATKRFTRQKKPFTATNYGPAQGPAPEESTATEG